MNLTLNEIDTLIPQLRRLGCTCSSPELAPLTKRPGCYEVIHEPACPRFFDSLAFRHRPGAERPAGSAKHSHGTKRRARAVDNGPSDD